MSISQVIWQSLPEGQVKETFRLFARELDRVESLASSTGGSTSALPVAAFRAYRNAALATSGSSQTIVMDTEDFDYAGEFDTTTGIFTPRYSGVYLISAGVGYSTNQADGAFLDLKIEEAGLGTVRYFYYNKIGGLIQPQFNGCDLLKATAGQQYTVTVAGGTGNFLSSSDATWFSGLLVALT